MRILFITQDDPFYIREFFSAFLEKYPGREKIIGAVLCSTMGESRLDLLRRLLGFYGPWDFSRVMLRYLRTSAAKAMTRNEACGLERTFRSYGIEILRTSNVNQKEFVEQLRRMEPDLIVSVAAPYIFKKQLLEVPRIGCINIHTAKLPKYRGMMPNFWVMYNNEPRSAITIHTMDTKIDRGQVLLQREFDLNPEESLDQLIKRTKRLGAEHMVEVIQGIEQHGIVPIEVPPSEPSYYSFPKKEHVKAFRLQGKRLL